jgi:hypothetical protein
LPGDPLCDLIHSWREQGVYQKALIDGHPAVEGTLATSVDRDTVVSEVKDTCATYHLVYRIAGEKGGLPFITIRAKDGDLERTLMVFTVPGGGATMIKFSFQEEADPDLVSIVDLMPELNEIGTKIEFKKENFADGLRSGLLIYQDEWSPEFALDRGESVLVGAGWTRLDLSQTAEPDPALVFKKERFFLILRARQSGRVATLTCTISERAGEATRVRNPKGKGTAAVP